MKHARIFTCLSIAFLLSSSLILEAMKPGKNKNKGAPATPAPTPDFTPKTETTGSTGLDKTVAETSAAVKEALESAHLETKEETIIKKESKIKTKLQTLMTLLTAIDESKLQRPLLKKDFFDQTDNIKWYLENNPEHRSTESFKHKLGWNISEKIAAFITDVRTFSKKDVKKHLVSIIKTHKVPVKDIAALVRSAQKHGVEISSDLLGKTYLMAKVFKQLRIYRSLDKRARKNERIRELKELQKLANTARPKEKQEIDSDDDYSDKSIFDHLEKDAA